MKTVKKAAEILVSVFLWMIILITALFTFTTLATRDDNSISRVAGYTPLIVKSPSMKPTFNEGDLIVIKKVDPSTLKVGDVITFKTLIDNAPALNTHRIVEITEQNGIRNYATKGDNNAVKDQVWIADGAIQGKYVCKLPLLGRLMTVLSSSTGFLLIIVLPMLCFFVYQVYHLIMVSINLKKAIAAEEATDVAQRESEADAKLAEAQAALAEAQRLKEEMEARMILAGNEPKAEANAEAKTDENVLENVNRNQNAEDES